MKKFTYILKNCHILFKKKVLDYVQYLLAKAEQQENQDWASLSLPSAMRDMEDEPDLYSLSDLRIIFA